MPSGPCDLKVSIVYSWSCTPLSEVGSLGIFPCRLSFRFGNLECPSCVKTRLSRLPKASAFCLSSLIMFPAMLRSPIPWLSCLSLKMKLQNTFGLLQLLGIDLYRTV